MGLALLNPGCCGEICPPFVPDECDEVVDYSWDFSTDPFADVGVPYWLGSGPDYEWTGSDIKVIHLGNPSRADFTTDVWQEMPAGHWEVFVDAAFMVTVADTLAGASLYVDVAGGLELVVIYPFPSAGMMTISRTGAANASVSGVSPGTLKIKFNRINSTQAVVTYEVAGTDYSGPTITWNLGAEGCVEMAIGGNGSRGNFVAEADAAYTLLDNAGVSF